MKDIKSYINESLKNDKSINEMVSAYGRTELTYDDIPKIMNGEIHYDTGRYDDNDKYWVLKLPNGKYTNYNCNDKERKATIENILDHYSSYESKTKQEMERYLKFKLKSKDEAEEWLLGKEICDLYDKLGYETNMWSQLGHIGGITITKDGKEKNIVGSYPKKKELQDIIDKLTNKL